MIFLPDSALKLKKVEIEIGGHSLISNFLAFQKQFKSCQFELKITFFGFQYLAANLHQCIKESLVTFDNKMKIAFFKIIQCFRSNNSYFRKLTFKDCRIKAFSQQ